MKSNRLLSIQYLRGIAAIAVIAYHTHWTPLTTVGAAGVDLFFVISGFVMMLVSQGVTPAAFVRARILRLVPLYWALTLLGFCVWPGSLPHLALSLLFIPHGSGLPILGLGWTLNCEMFFYALVAGSLLLPETVRLRSLSAVICALFGVGLLLRPEMAAARVYTSTFLLEFLAGALIFTCRAWLTPRIAALLAGAGVAGAVAAIHLPEPTSARVILWGLPMALIFAGSVGLDLSGYVPKWPVLLLVGDASYSIYLSQQFTLDWVRPAFEPLPGVIAIPLATGACVAAGVLLYVWVERPMMRFFRGHPLPLRPAPMPLS